MSRAEKEIRQVFVIMPYKTLTREYRHLALFFENNIKAPIEKANFNSKYIVSRYDESFDITANLIKNLQNADIVICDLSGVEGQPNVMYQLGVRLAVSNKPNILIREKHRNNTQIFDISGFYTYLYDKLDYPDLTKFLIKAIEDIDAGTHKYLSPVRAILNLDSNSSIESKNNKKLKVFLCHSSHDKQTARGLFEKFSSTNWIDAWFDEEKLLPGQDWEYEIEKALDITDVVIVLLSRDSVTKEGYVQRELRFIIDIALEKPEGAIFILPVRLEDCEPPRKLRTYQYADYFPTDQRERVFRRILASLQMRAAGLGIPSTDQK